MLPAVHTSVRKKYRRKHRWHPHIHMSKDHYKSAQRALLRLYDQYRPMLCDHYQPLKNKIVSLWMHEDCAFLSTIDRYLLPLTMNIWIDRISSVQMVAQIAHQNCTLCVVECQV